MKEVTHYTGRPNHCPGAIIHGRRVPHGPGLRIPTADVSQRHEVDQGQVIVSTVVNGAGLCESCSRAEADERADRKRRAAGDFEGSRGRGRERVG